MGRRDGSTEGTPGLRAPENGPETLGEMYKMPVGGATLMDQSTLGILSDLMDSFANHKIEVVKSA